MTDEKLIFAARTGNLEEVKRLISLGYTDYVPVFYAPTDTGTALSHATAGGHKEVALFLLETFENSYKVKKAKTNIFSSLFNKIMSPIRNQHAKFMLAKYINAGEGKDGVTAFSGALYKDSLEMCELLIQKGANPNYRETGMPVLAACANRGQADLVKMLIAKGARVDAKADSKPFRKFTPLMFAARKGHVDAMDVLLANKAKINAKSSDDQTALIIAAKYGKTKAVAALLKNSTININHKDKEGKTAFDWALATHTYPGSNLGKGIVERMEIIELLLKKGANKVTNGSLQVVGYPVIADDMDLLLAVIDGDASELDRLAAKGGHFFLHSHCADIATCIAAKNGHLEVVKRLYFRNDYALLSAAANGQLHVVQHMIGKAEPASLPSLIGFKDENNKLTALDYAAARGHVDVVALLLNKGAAVEYIALKEALKNGHVEICIMLVKALKETAFELRNLRPFFFRDVISNTLGLAWKKPDKTDFKSLLKMLFPNGRASLAELPEYDHEMFAPAFKNEELLFAEHKKFYFEKMLKNIAYPIKQDNEISPSLTVARVFYSSSRTPTAAQAQIPSLPVDAQVNIADFLFGDEAKTAVEKDMKESRLDRGQRAVLAY